MESSKYGVPLSFKTGDYPPTVHALLAPYKGVAMPGCCLAMDLDFSGEGPVKGDWNNNGAFMQQTLLRCSFACARQFFLMPPVAEDNLPMGRRHGVLHKKTLQLLDFMDLNLPENA